MVGTTTALLLGPPVSAGVAAVRLGRKVSGTEVYFQREMTVGPPSTLTHPAYTHKDSLKEERKWKLVSLTPLLCSFYLKKNK